MPSPSTRLADLGIDLPPPPTPAGSYSAVVVDSGMAFVSGQVVLENGKAVHPGLVGSEVDPAEAKQLARRATLQALSALAHSLGSIDRVRRVGRVVVYVASAPSFTRQHEVANGATELLISIFGENGRPARAAVGAASLPLNVPVEVELVAFVE